MRNTFRSKNVVQHLRVGEESCRSDEDTKLDKNHAHKQNIAFDIIM